ncbi:ATP-binding protein [Streptomyces sp. NPDC096030]|uniref:ATP-binding protein n=1 Tax=Streptomyces sp. NPDC096030 TaxID=3155423 RepID=UPI0033348B07
MDVEGFRGIPHRMTLNFWNSPDVKPASCLLLGENGTGKSTFVDAIEFCLTGRYSRLPGESKQSSLRGLRNFAMPDGVTSVEVEFADGAKFRRSIELRDGELSVIPEAPHPSFRGSGLTLHREQIISFLRSAPRARRGIFAEFMRSAAATSETPIEYLNAIDDAEDFRKKKVRERDEVARELATASQSSFGNMRARLHDVQSFNSWFASRGHSRKQAERRSGRLTPGRKRIYALASSVRRAIEEVRRSTEQVVQAKKAAASAPLFSLLAQVGQDLTDGFRKISPAADSFESVSLELASESSEISLSVTLGNGTKVHAEGYFSEANLDLLALLLFLSLMKFAGEHGQPKIMALDDVLQSRCFDQSKGRPIPSFRVP